MMNKKIIIPVAAAAILIITGAVIAQNANSSKNNTGDDALAHCVQWAATNYPSTDDKVAMCNYISIHEPEAYRAEFGGASISKLEPTISPSRLDENCLTWTRNNEKLWRSMSGITDRIEFCDWLKSGDPVIYEQQFSK